MASLVPSSRASVKGPSSFGGQMEPPAGRPLTCLLPPPLHMHPGVRTHRPSFLSTTSHVHKLCRALGTQTQKCPPLRSRPHTCSWTSNCNTQEHTHAHIQAGRHCTLRTDGNQLASHTSTNAQLRTEPPEPKPRHRRARALPPRARARARGRPHPTHLPSVGPEGEAALPAAHGGAAAAARLTIWPAPSRSRLPRARVTLATQAAPPLATSPGIVRVPAGCGPAAGGSRAERTACSRRPRAGGGGFAGLSQLGTTGAGLGVASGEGAGRGVSGRTRPTLHPSNQGCTGLQTLFCR